MQKLAAILIDGLVLVGQGLYYGLGSRAGSRSR